MNLTVRTASHIFWIDKIACAHVYPDQTVVYPVGYHAVHLGGEDANKMNAALQAAGFIGGGMLVNPARITVIEDAGETFKVYLDGIDRVIVLERQYEAQLFPALETAEKPRRKKEAAS